MPKWQAVVVFAFVLVAGLSFQPSPAAAENMTWNVLSKYPYKVQVAFYSQSRNHSWPGGTKAYNLNDTETHTYALNCVAGERVCLGGWVTGNANKYWGVGYRVSQDEGKTWSEPQVLVDLGKTADGGYPWSIQLPDGAIVTAYYSGPSGLHPRYYMGAAHWRVDAK